MVMELGGDRPYRWNEVADEETKGHGEQHPQGQQLGHPAELCNRTKESFV